MEEDWKGGGREDRGNSLKSGPLSSSFRDPASRWLSRGPAGQMEGDRLKTLDQITDSRWEIRDPRSEIRDPRGQIGECLSVPRHPSVCCMRFQHVLLASNHFSTNQACTHTHTHRATLNTFSRDEARRKSSDRRHIYKNTHTTTHKLRIANKHRLNTTW